MFFIYSRQVVDKTTVINGVAVPPEPAPWANNSTLAGVDSNGNGVRDDVERMIARQFGGTSDYSFALAYAREYQRIIVEPTPTDRFRAIESYFRVMCNVRGSSESVRMLSMDRITANTATRENAHRAFLDIMGGVSGGDFIPCATD